MLLFDIIVKLQSLMSKETLTTEPHIIEQLKQKLSEMGGTIILTEEELRASQMWKKNEVERPLLAFNCVGGPSSTELCKALAEGGVHVTYGGMSRKPVMAATSHMIFKDLIFDIVGKKDKKVWLSWATIRSSNVQVN